MGDGFWRDLDWWDEMLEKRIRRANDTSTPGRPIVSVTDAKSVYDHLIADKGASSSDRRISLEATLIREEMESENISIKWLPTTHMLAD